MAEQISNYTKATRAIEGILNEYFGGLTHRFVVAAVGIDKDGALREKVLVPENQLYSDTRGQIAYAEMVVNTEHHLHYLHGRIRESQGLDPDGDDET